MISRYCTGIALSSLKKTRRTGTKTLKYLDGFPYTYIATGELSKGIWSMTEICQSIIKTQSSHKSFGRSNSTYATLSKPVVVHDPIGKLFYIDLNGKGRAYLGYEQIGGLIKIMSTEVPEAFAGQGYAKLLAQKALEFVAQNDYQLEVDCGFVSDYIRKYAPQYLKYMKH